MPGYAPGRKLRDGATTKPGYQTTEFWVTVVTAVVSLLTGLGVIGPDLGNRINAHVEVIAFIAATTAVAAYNVARGIAKHGQRAAHPGGPVKVMQPDPDYTPGDPVVADPAPAALAAPAVEAPAGRTTQRRRRKATTE